MLTMWRKRFTSLAFGLPTRFSLRLNSLRLNGLNPGLGLSQALAPASQPASHPYTLHNSNSFHSFSDLQHPILARSGEDDVDYSDFGSLVETLRTEITNPGGGAKDQEDANRITDLLANIRLNPREWGQYTNFVGNRYTRTLVGCDEKFVVLLLSWEKGQVSPVHCHADSSCWVKVLSGNLQETIYRYPDEDEKQPLQLTSECVFAPEQATFMDDSHGIHKMGNPRLDEPCVSLHVYSPPYTACNIFDRMDSEATSVYLKTVYNPLKAGESFDPDVVGDGEGDYDMVGLVDHVTKISLDTFVFQVNAELKKPEKEFRSDVVAALLSKLVLSKDEWGRFVNFGEESYTRNLLLVNKYFSLMLLCWTPGQATPAHSHGPDRKAWFKVLTGEITVTEHVEGTQDRQYQMTSKKKTHNRRKRVYSASDPVVYEGPDDTVHITGNLGSHNAVSIHVYSPPYLKLTCTDDESNRRHLPVVHYGCMFDHPISAGCEVYSNFRSFKSLLNHVFARYNNVHSAEFHDAVTSLMTQIQFNPEEWRSLVVLNSDHFTRVLVGESDEWMLILTCWDKTQGTPIHDHQASYNWIKVLDGQMMEETYKVPAGKEDTTQGKILEGEAHFKYDEVEKLRSGVLPTDSVTFLNKHIIHRLWNATSKPALTLHLYAPPYRSVKAYDVTSGETELLFLPVGNQGEGPSLDEDNTIDNAYVAH